jgi:predicted short-subunit dehydrogenase-like oxidoreductase (DUF2520 family)
MRQIPNYGIIGSGRLSCHLSHYFSSSNIHYNSWSRKHNSTTDLPEFVNKSDVIFLLIKDDAIESFIKQYPVIKSKILIHCSGSLITDKAIGMHPLMSFGDELYDFLIYQKMAFIIDENADFTQIFPTLENPHYQIKKQHKPYYHALCVMSGNFSSILWSKLFSELEQKLNIPKEAAFSYLESVGNNLMHDYKTALTGPLIRGDKTTINSNLAALSDDEFLPIYQAVVKLFGAKS